LDSRDASARKDSFRDASHRVARIFLVAFASASDSRRVARASTSGATATRPVSLTVSSRLVSSRLVSRMTTSIDTPDCLPIEIRTGATAVAELTERRARIRRRATARATARARKATTTQQKGARAPCGSLQRRGDAG